MVRKGLLRDWFVTLAPWHNSTIALPRSDLQPMQIDTNPRIPVLATLVHWQNSIIVHRHSQTRALLATTKECTLSPAFVILAH